MKFGFYISRKATRFCLALQNGILHKNNTAFALTDYPDSPDLKEYCNKFEIQLYNYSYKENNLIGKERNKVISDIFLNLLEKNNSAYGFTWGGRLLLVGELLIKYKNKLITFHPSLLPAFKGTLSAIDDALKENVLLLGNTAHFINEKADDGIMIMQSILCSYDFKDYDDVLNLQLSMIKQIVLWIKQERFMFDNNRFYIRNAKYKIDTFIPNLEF